MCGIQRKCRIFLFSVVSLILTCDGSENPGFTGVPCDYTFAVTSEMSTTSVLEIGVFAGKDFNASEIIEIQPVALVPSINAANNILLNYVHGYNKTHTVILFGASSLVNHGSKNLLDNRFEAEGEKFETNPVASLRAVTKIKEGREVFTFYNSFYEDSAGRRYKVPWFKKRGLPYVDTSSASYSDELTSAAAVLEGCSDNKHLKKREEGGVQVELSVKEGEVIETNRVLFFFNDELTDEIESLSWKLSKVKMALSLGIILPFAEFGTDKSKVNVKVEWWENQVFYSQKMGVMAVKATKDIKAGERLYIYSESDTERVFTEEVSEVFNAQRTWLQFVVDQYERTTFEGKMYSSLALLIVFTFIVF